MASANLTSDRLTIALVESLDDTTHIVFDVAVALRGEQLLSARKQAFAAFRLLAMVLEVYQRDRLPIHVNIKGCLGKDLEWHSFVGFNSLMEARKIFRKWYTQAVQAQAATVSQLVREVRTEDLIVRSTT